jgi:hypothetical protein
VKRAIFLATAALLAMLVLAPMAWTQEDLTVRDGTTMFAVPTSSVFAGGGGGGNGSPAPTPATGGSAILLPAAVLLLGYPDLRVP